MYFFEVSSRKRILQCTAAIFWCLLGAGPIFGFAALKPTLIAQGIYENVCTADEKSQFTSEGLNFVAKCTSQDLKLNMMFTVGAALTNICALVIGAVLDSMGPRVCGFIASAFLYLSCCCFIWSKGISTFLDPYLVGYSLMALGGPFAYISSFQLSNAFPEKSGLILAIITGSFDTSSAIFLLYKKLFLKFPGFFTLSNFYKLYLFVPTFIIIAQITFMPKESYMNPPADIIPNPTPGQRRLSQAMEVESRYHVVDAAILGEDGDDDNEATALLQSPLQDNTYGERPSPIRPPLEPAPVGRRSSLGEAYKSAYIEGELEASTSRKEDPQHMQYSIFGILHGFPTSYQFRTWWFSLMCIYSTVQMLRLNYFVATVNSQYSYLFHSHPLADKLNRVFDISLPLGGIVSVPVVGMILDNFSTSYVLCILVGMSLIIGVLGIVQGLFSAGLLNVLMFVCFRPFFYTTVSDYCAKVFGFETFGTLYGAIMTVAGVFNILQSYLDKITHTTFHMNPIPVNLLLVVLTVITGGSLVAYVCAQTNLYSKRKAHRSVSRS